MYENNRLRIRDSWCKNRSFSQTVKINVTNGNFRVTNDNRLPVLGQNKHIVLFKKLSITRCFFTKKTCNINIYILTLHSKILY